MYFNISHPKHTHFPVPKTLSLAYICFVYFRAGTHVHNLVESSANSKPLLHTHKQKQTKNTAKLFAVNFWYREEWRR